MRTLIVAKYVYAPGYPGADSLIIEDDLITWVGQYSAVKYLDIEFDQTIDLPNYFVAPGFVDSHVHLSATGALETGLDLRTASSAKEALALLEDFAQTSSDIFLLGHGWEDTNWPDAEDWEFSAVANIIGDRYLYLSRIDVHSAMVHTPMHQGIVFQKDHHAVREFVQRELPADQRRKNIEAALKLAARNGIVSVHENGGPVVSGRADFLDVLDIASRSDLPEVFAYWGTTDLDEVRELGAYGAAGDLTVDGSIGSRTALLNDEYIDNPAELAGNVGTEFLTTEQLAQHLINCTKIGIQGGFHAIGDRALDQVIAALELAEAECGTAAVRAARHRIEHAEMLDPKHLAYLNSLGVVLSMQPIFDELWGITDGLYDQRLGTTRSHRMNTFNSIAQSGITMAFSSDSPVTPIDPWRSVAAAMNHHKSEHRISSRAAFTAHTRGGWRAANKENAGVIAEGMLAHLAIWDASGFAITVPDDRVRAWSTDERSGTPPLPDLALGAPRCVATIRAGKPIYDPENIWH